MGCTSSAGSQAGGAVEAPAARSSDKKRLLDTYSVDLLIGQGAFGTVYACKPIGQDRECAVKMVDKVETPLDKIKGEAEMLQKMNHPNVIKCHDVIYERCFVCIVMDRLRGGDLIVGMQAHWKSKGKIPVMSTVHISAQMASSISYLHNQSIIHRDVKGDNYLCDRTNIVDPQCRIVLTDFGTAVPCQATDKLRDTCGTKLYWSPEFHKLNYSLKVDVWAMGVVVYGLLNGKFPFRDEKEIHNKEVIVPNGTPEDCTAFLLSILEKNEDKRADSEKVMKDPWIAKEVTKAGIAAVGDDDPDFNPDEEAFREGGANQDIQDRRNELVDRLHEAGAKKTKPSESKPEENYWKEWFSIVDRQARNSTLKYEWWSHNKVEEAGILSLDGAKAVSEGGSSTVSTEVLGRQLTEHGIDVSKFGAGKAKSLQELAAELHMGSSVLMLDATQHRKLVRVVDVVLLRLCAPGTKNKFVIETSEKFSDGRERETGRLPGTKKEPHENTKQTAERIVVDLLNLGDAKVLWDFSNKEIFEEENESPSYPGLVTIYRKEVIEGVLQGESTSSIGGDANAKDWYKEDATKNTKYFAWKSDKECDKLNIQYKQPDRGDDVSGLVQAPIGMNDKDLTAYFEANSVDISRFGSGQAKSIKDISAELIKGDCTLMQKQGGGVIRLVDVVVINLEHSVGRSVLVQTEQTFPDGTKVQLKRLPGAKRRHDENQFLTARRILKRQLKIDENHVAVDASNVQIVEEEKDSLAYPGLRTMYRKRIITATLSKGD